MDTDNPVDQTALDEFERIIAKVFTREDLLEHPTLHASLLSVLAEAYAYGVCRGSVLRDPETS